MNDMKSLNRCLRYGFLIVFVLMIFVLNAPALADDTGIQIIGGPDEETETVSMDDFKPGDTVKIEGFGEVTFKQTLWTDELIKFSSNLCYLSALGKWNYVEYYNSGSEAMYLSLTFDLLNTQKEPCNFYSLFSNIICTYDEEYQFGGWVRQRFNVEDRGESISVLNDTADGWPINTFYRGQYDVVITLPLDVVRNVNGSDKPLSVTFSIGDNEFTVNLGK